MVGPSFHLRRSGSGASHYVDNRTLLTLCRLPALDWPLALDAKSTPDCEKCRKLLDNVKVEK